MTRWRLRHTLVWKELRTLWIFAGAFLVLELAVALLVWQGARVAELFSSGTFQTLTLLLWGAVLGLVAFGAENEAGTWTLLRGLALPPAAVLGSKACASALVLAAVVSARWLGTPLLGLPDWPPPSATNAAILTLGVCVAWALGAWWTTTRPSVAGGVSLMVILSVARGWTLWGPAPGWIVLEIVGLALLLGRLARWITHGPSSSDRQARVSPSSRWTGWPVGLSGNGWPLALFWRIEGRSTIWALGLPLALLLLPLARSSPGLFFLPVPLLAAWLGAGVVHPDERSAGQLFLHHLPIPRHRWLLPRLVLGLLLGVALIAVCVSAVLLCHGLGWAGPLWRYEPLLLTMSPAFLGIYGLAYLLAAMLAPWLGQRILVAILSLVTLALLSAVGLPAVDSPLRSLAGLVACGGVAWWSLTRSSAFEPGRGRTPRVLGMVGLVWLVLGLLAIFPR